MKAFEKGLKWQIDNAFPNWFSGARWDFVTTLAALFLVFKDSTNIGKVLVSQNLGMNSYEIFSNKTTLLAWEELHLDEKLEITSLVSRQFCGTETTRKWLNMDWNGPISIALLVYQQ